MPANANSEHQQINTPRNLKHCPSKKKRKKRKKHKTSQRNYYNLVTFPKEKQITNKDDNMIPP